jgi:predicted outer membrane repeat protein
MDVSSSGTATLSGNTISGNSADFSGGGIYVDSSSGAVAIQENLVLYNTAFGSEGGGGIEVSKGQPTLNRNDLLSNSPRQLRNGNPASSPNLDARDNWWGTTNEANIQSGIWDGNDSSSLGVVNWQPYLDVPIFSNHPPSPLPVSPQPMGPPELPRTPN